MTLTGAQPLSQNTYRDYPLGRPLHTFIEAQAARTPEAVAATFEDEALSYAELNAKANQLARRLQRLGVGPDVLVGVCLERSLEMVVGLLAVLKAGGTYVPIDPGYPEDRIAFMLGDADPPVLLSQARFRDTLPAHGAKLYLDTDWSEVAWERSEPVNADVNSENLAYVIYTSGSTGQPKGAMNPHRAIVNRLLWMQEAYPIGPSDAVLQKTPFSFDVSVWEFFWPLMTGARLVVAKPDGHKDANYMADLIQREDVTVTHFVPSMLYLFLEETNLGERCKSLKHVVCSGEALPFDLQERFFAKIDAQLHNLYGPTEAAVDVTHWTCRKDSLERVVPIGYPVANTQIHILDEAHNPVSDGQEGELHIGGVQVARGYHKRPELTAERFIPDPFSEDPDARLYKTGDLARRRGDGAAEFLGRTDFQVKLRGFRVELGEIEAVLNSFGGVKQSVVVAQARAGEMRLVAYLVPQKEPASRSELNRFLEAKLPDYMVPAVFVNLSELPLSPNGKVDRKRLPEPTRQRPDVEGAYAPPRNDLERFLAQLWAQTLDLERVGIYDKFFELGGSSLQAAQFVNRLQKELGEFIYIVTIFGAPSVAEYAAMLKRDYAGAVAERFGGTFAPQTSRVAKRSQGVPAGVTAQKLRDFQKVIPKLRLRAEEGPKNPPAIFILAPPRSGTTLLRVMLAGHPKLFAAAELQLLSFNTLAERKEAFTGKFSLWLEGALRAVMELQNCDADEARRIMADFEERLSTKEFYEVIQTWVGERILVDKSPHYALDLGSLQKAERDFDDALYIHLTRHPYASIKSFENYHMDQVLYLNEHDFGARDLGEMVWAQSHANVLTFLQDVSQERQFRLRYEDLVADPEPLMQALCERFGLEYHPALVNPYGDIDQKMTDGLYRDSTPMGDTHLLERRSIDAGAADKWRGVESDNFLSEPTWQVAETLRYARPEPSHQAEAANTSTNTSKRRSLERQRQLRQRRRSKS